MAAKKRYRFMDFFSPRDPSLPLRRPDRLQELRLGDLVVVERVYVIDLGLRIERLGVGDFDDRAHADLIASVGEIEVFFRGVLRRLQRLDPLLGAHEISIALLDLQNNLLSLLQGLRAERVIRPHRLFYPVSRTKAVEDGDVETEPHLPGRQKRERV